MTILALDIGKRRTGVAFADDDMRVPLALDTLNHASDDEFLEKVLSLMSEKDISKVVVGLPLLPSGEEGSQVEFVRSITQKLEDRGISVEYIDERYTTPKKGLSDGDAAAACAILGLYFEQRK